MRHHDRLVPSALFASLLTACGGSTYVPPSPAAQVAVDCTALALGPAITAVDYILEHFETVTNASSFALNYTSGAAYTLSGDVTVLLGTLADGFDVGEQVEVDWSMASNGGFSGSGTFWLNFIASDQLDVTGTGSIADGSCSFDFSGVSWSANPSRNNPDLIGVVSFSTVAGLDPLAGAMTFAGDDFARVSAGFRGGAISFSIDLDDMSVEY